MSSLKLRKRLTSIHEHEVGFLEEPPFDSGTIRHVKEMCGIEEDSWASTYISLGGGSAALAVNFYHAAHAEIKLHFDKVGTTDQSAEHYYIAVLEFFLGLIAENRRRNLEQSKSTGRRNRRGPRGRRA